MYQQILEFLTSQDDVEIKRGVDLLRFWLKTKHCFKKIKKNEREFDSNVLRVGLLSRT